ncbi:MAG: DNRLRE domain-containing protein [Methanobacteriota archaeon]|nr:MAG: DNRLRE domain-containing protein [Euryarchaeota archaeon]
MGHWWSLVLIGAILLAPSVRADPAISNAGPDEGLVSWRFSNPANYTASDVVLGPVGSSLAWLSLSHRDTTRTDFSLSSSLTNIDLLRSAGRVLLANTSQPGPILNLTFQPDAASMVDTFIYSGNSNQNFGNAAQLFVGNWTNGTWTRSIVQSPAFPLPANATIVSARLELYYSFVINDTPMDISVHRVTNNWTEFGSTWNRRDGITPWDGAGGDFDPAVVATVAGITNVPGWYGWNVTNLVAAWWTSAIPNQGLMVRQVSDTTAIMGQKGFSSSEEPNVTRRPRLQLAYTTPSSHGRLVSAPIEAGGLAEWTGLWWNATIPAGTNATIRFRTGDSVPVDTTWTPWSAPLRTFGTPLAIPPTHYFQYVLDLFTPSATSPSVQDVTATYSRYSVSGSVTTEAFEPDRLQGWMNLTINGTTPTGTVISSAYSQDNGTSWLPVSSGGDLSASLVRGIRLQIILATNDTLVTPHVESITLRYRIGSGALVNPAVPWGIAVFALLTLLVLLRLRTSFAATSLLLIHTDGRVVGNAGADGPRDEVATSAMLTLVHQFVRDSFQGPQGTGGELKSFQVDDKEVTIAKGLFLYLAVVGKGTKPRALSSRLVRFLAGLESAYGPRLEKWDGLRSSTGNLDADLAWFLRKGYRMPTLGRAVRYHA